MLFISNFSRSFKILFKDKYIFLFSLIPILLGTTLFYYLGTFLYGDMAKMGKTWVEESVSSSVLSGVLHYVMMAVLTAALYFVISWGFVLVVSLIASPFNDLISSRVERIVNGEPPESINKSIRETIKKIGLIIINELKKVSFIGFVSIVAFLFSLIPVLTPIGLILSALLLSSSFLDYSWARHEFEFKSCFKFITKNIILFSLSGLLFLFIIAIPVLNVFAIPYAVIYYTILFVEKKKKVEVS